MVSDHFVIGFICGEGSFCFSTNKAGGKMYVSPLFTFRVHEKDSEIVELMKRHVDVGDVYSLSGRNTVEWRIGSESDLLELREYINQNAPDEWWLTEKGKNFDRWSDCLDIYSGGKTRTDEAIEIAEMAKDLNPDNGISSEKWDEFIKQKKSETIYTCGATTGDSSDCKRTVSGPDDRCYHHS